MNRFLGLRDSIAIIPELIGSESEGRSSHSFYVIEDIARFDIERFDKFILECADDIGDFFGYLGAEYLVVRCVGLDSRGVKEE